MSSVAGQRCVQTRSALFVSLPLQRTQCDKLALVSAESKSPPRGEVPNLTHFAFKLLPKDSDLTKHLHNLVQIRIANQAEVLDTAQFQGTIHSNE